MKSKNVNAERIENVCIVLNDKQHDNDASNEEC